MFQQRARLVLKLTQHGRLNRIGPGLLLVKPALVAGSLSAMCAQEVSPIATETAEPIKANALKPAA